MKKLRIFIIIILLPILVWVFSLLKCEILTILHGNEFKNRELETNMLSAAEYLKVLEYDKYYSEVYFVNEFYGCTLSFEKQNGVWNMTNWEAVWSKHGSASSVIWPYWWHFIYGGI